MQLGGVFWEIPANIAPRIAEKSLLVYTCDESFIGEYDKNSVKNRMCKRALRQNSLSCKTSLRLLTQNYTLF